MPSTFAATGGPHRLRRRLAWSPDGRRLATSSGDQTIRVWDTSDGRQQLLIREHNDKVWNIAWSPDAEKLVSVSTDRTARIFAAHDAKPLAVLRGHEDIVWGVTWSPDGTRIATGSEDRTVRTINSRHLAAHSSSSPSRTRYLRNCVVLAIGLSFPAIPILPMDTAAMCTRLARSHHRCHSSDLAALLGRVSK